MEINPKAERGWVEAHLATTTIQEEDVYSLSSPTGGEGWGEEADFIEYPSPLTLSPLVPRGAREKISGGCIKMRAAVSQTCRSNVRTPKALNLLACHVLRLAFSTVALRTRHRRFHG